MPLKLEMIVFFQHQNVARTFQNDQLTLVWTRSLIKGILNRIKIQQWIERASNHERRRKVVCNLNQNCIGSSE